MGATTVSSLSAKRAGRESSDSDKRDDECLDAALGQVVRTQRAGPAVPGHIVADQHVKTRWPPPTRTSPTPAAAVALPVDQRRSTATTYARRGSRT